MSNWDYSNSQWVVSNENVEYVYDTNGNLVTVNETYSENKFEYTFDTNGNQVSETDYNFDTNTSQWLAYWKSENAYDLSQGYLNNLMPSDFFFLMSYDLNWYYDKIVNIPTVFTYYYLVNQVLTPDGKDFFYYSDFTSGGTTAIPDANFEQALIDLGIDTDGV